MLRETPEDPNEFTFSAAASACEKANLWQSSLGLLFELRQPKMAVGDVALSEDPAPERPGCGRLRCRDHGLRCLGGKVLAAGPPPPPAGGCTRILGILAGRALIKPVEREEAFLFQHRLLHLRLCL
ncbi:unnamed protein product [Symbiodinium sp. CCMP2592]|nr:unnamed protein product [Symbiodinium sp. CCMP2592]